MVKHLFYILICLTFIISCSDRKSTEALRFPSNPLISDEKGLPVDSSVHYFPDSLLLDTVKHYIDSLELKYRIIDRSYVLFNLKEPVLSNYYLHKQIYRVISFPTLRPAFCIRIEKSENSVAIVFKRLNKSYGPPQLSWPSGKVIPTDPLSIVINKSVNISNAYWDTLEMYVDSTKLWKDKPRIDLNDLQIDGSVWIIEGHEESGYQIKAIPSPIFSKNDASLRKNEYDPENKYATLFKYMMKISGMGELNLY